MNGKFPIAVHIMTLLCYEGGLISSDFIAGSLNVHAVLVRKALRELMDNGLVVSKEGKNGGYQLSRPAADIQLAEIYGSVKQNAFLGSTRNTPNPDCPVGRQIAGQLDLLYQEVETALLKKLARKSLQTFCDQFH